MSANWRTVRLYGKTYRWRDTRAMRGGLSLVPVWPQVDEEFVSAETVGPMWPTPCAAWWQEQYRRDVSRSRETIEARLINPEEKTDAQ